MPSFIALQRRAGGGSEKLQDAKLDLLLQKITMGRLDLEERQGKLVPIEAVSATWRNVVVLVRARILNLPSKLAPRLLGKRHAAEVETIIRADVYEALEDLADNVEIRYEGKSVNGGSHISPQA